MSQRIIVLFNLRQGVDPQAYEDWARATDIPTASALPSVQGFEVLRSTGLFGSDAPPPYQYIEVLDVGSLDGLVQDASSPAMQEVAAKFQEWADNPVFITTERL